MIGRVFHLGLLAAAAVAILGCGGGSSSGNSSNQTPSAAASFSLSAPVEITVTPSSLQTISISVVPTNGFSSAVNVVLSGLPSGVTATPSTFTLTPGNETQTITIQANASATPGPISMSVTGTSGSLSQSAATTTGQADFSLIGPSLPIALTAGGTAQVIVSAVPFNGFNGQISTTLVGLPAGVTASPANFELTPGATQTITLTADASAQPVSLLTLGLEGTSGDLTNNLDLSLTVSSAGAAGASGFSLSANPAAVTLMAGGSAIPVTLTATPINGFSEPIQVQIYSLPGGVAATPSILILTPGAPQQISFTAASTDAASTGTVILEASDQEGVQFLGLPLTINPHPPAFSLQVSPATVTLAAGGGPQSVSVTADALYGFSGQVNVALSGIPAGVTVSPAALMLTPGVAQTMNLTAASNATAGTGSLNLVATSGTISNSASVGLTVDTATADFVFSATPSTITVTPGTFQPVVLSIVPLSGFNSGVMVTTGSLPDGVVVSPVIGFGSAGGDFPAPAPILPIAPNVPEVLYVGLPAGNSAPVTIQFQAAAGALTHSAAVTASPASTSNPGSDLYLTSARSGLMLYPGVPYIPEGPGEVEINPAGFNGSSPTPTISLTSSLPSGMTSTTVSLDLDNAGLGMNFMVTPDLVGTSGILTFQAASGSMTREIDVPYSVVAAPEFTQLLIPSTILTLPQGSSEYFYIALAGTQPNNVLSSISMAGLPSGVTWLPAGIYIPGIDTQQLSAAATTAVGQTTLTAKTTAYGLTQSSQLTLNVVSIPNFVLTPTPTAFNMMAGTTQTFTLEADAINGFTGDVGVNLTALGGVTVTPSTFTLTPGTLQQISVSAPTTSTISTNVPNGGTPGDITVQATAGTLSQSLLISVDVTPPPAP